MNELKQYGDTLNFCSYNGTSSSISPAGIVTSEKWFLIRTWALSISNRRVNSHNNMSNASAYRNKLHFSVAI